MSQSFINATDARKNFFDLLSQVKRRPFPVQITVKGVPEAVLMSKEDYDAWMATYETLMDKELMGQIKSGDADIKAGRYVSLEAVEKELGFDVSNQPVKSGTKKSKKAR